MWRSGPGKRTNYMEQNMPVMQSALTPMQDNFYHSMAECMLRGVPPPPTRPRTPEPEGTERPPPVGNAFYQDSRFFYKPPVESERAMCTICAKCDEDAPDPAEYKCYSCVKYDAHGKGHFCKACFKARHPPHRVKHVWQRIENEENLDEAANDQLVRAEMDKQIAGINATIQSLENSAKTLEAHDNDDRPHDLMRAAAQGTVGAEGKVKRLRKKLKKEMDMRQILEDQRPKGRLYNLRHNIGTNTGPDPTPAIEEEGAADEEGSLALSHTGSHGQEGSVGQLSRELSVQSFFAPTNKQVAADKSEESSLEGSLSKDVSLPRIGNIGGGEGGSLIGGSLVGGSLVGGSLQTSSLEASELSGVLVGRDDGKITSHKGGQKQELSFSFQEMQAVLVLQGGARRFLARKRLRRRVAQVYVKCYSDESEAHYYLDTRDGTTSWSPPSLLFHDDGTMDETIRLLTPRAHKRMRKGGQLEFDNLDWRRPKDYSEVQAATKLQAVWRRIQGQKKAREKVIQRYQRVLDEASGKYYFIDMATKVSSWKRPPMINKAMEEYILTPRRFRAMRQEANEKLPSLTRQKARKKKAKGRAKY